MASAPEPTPNSLGLDFDQLKIQDPPETEPKAEEAPKSPSVDTAESAERKKPYVNPERVKTGGNQRDKLSEEALSERMARMREQNEKIKQRRADVEADELAFKKTQESERVKQEKIRKVQEGVDRTREQNAKRKLDKMQSREWDSGKPAGGGDWKQRQPAKSPENHTSADEVKTDTASTPSSPPAVEGGWTRGGSPRGSPQARGATGRGRGRGRGGATGGPSERATESDPKPSTSPAGAAAAPQAEAL
ncbi:hypothetical protein C8F04DRAFT_38047 [Mycena alexandri]|uniref:Uncharacterized protein n=1 Tax=Mycena alexandri TaxID=1745969 RepID=A0AAD6TDI8_9AGAR|nr:hypothetical protein C8F04DRAFT_38047 [Mycena alexandri]